MACGSVKRTEEAEQDCQAWEPSRSKVIAAGEMATTDSLAPYSSNTTYSNRNKGRG